jgi:hypothetical protein
MSRLALAWAGPAMASTAETDTIGAITAAVTRLRTVVTTFPFVGAAPRPPSSGAERETAWT